MRTSREAVAVALHEGAGVIARRDHPDLYSSIAWLARAGALDRVLPGIYCAPELRDDPTTRIRAALLWCPDGILTGRAAAKVSFWPEVKIREVTVATLRNKAVGAGQGFGVTLQRRVIPPELVMERNGFRSTTAALTALDLCSDVGADAIDVALRTRATSLTALKDALAMTRHRSGNTQRRQHLLDSRDEPWSKLERRTHRLLREAGLTGWQSNFPVPTPIGQYYLDIAFPELMVAIELDGWEFHSSYQAFQSDRHRQNWLVKNGWRVLRFTWEMLVDAPELVLDAIRQTLEMSLQPGLATRRSA